MSADKRRIKWFQRENRKNKGVSATTKTQKRSALIRDARSLMGGWQTEDESMLLLAASMMGGRR